MTSKLVILGSSNAISDEDHENTHLVVVGTERKVLVDCALNSISRLRRVGVDFNDLTDLILTHFHPDHVSGVPLLLMNMWLMGRQRSINIYGLQHTMSRMESMLGLFGWSEWPDFFPVAFHPLPADEMTTVIDCDDFHVYSSPVQHFIPTIGLRFEFKRSHKVLAYSCDTEPCEQVIRLAEGADILLHEASGPQPGHSSAMQAGDIARQAEVGSLYLIHYPTGKYAQEGLEEEARQRFQGPIKKATDFMTIEF
jgi:ribonuclease Z